MNDNSINHTDGVKGYLCDLYKDFTRIKTDPSRFIYAFALLAVFFMPVSLSWTTLLLSFAGVVWIISIIRKKIVIQIPPFFPFLLAFGILSIVSIFFSLDATVSLKMLKKSPLILIPLLYYDVVDNRIDRAKMIYALYAGMLMSSAWGFVMYFSGSQHRLSGFIGHYMTTAGLLMMVIIILLSGLLSFGFQRFGAIRFTLLGFFFFALMLTLTRSAWVGTAVAFIILFTVIRPKLVPLVIVIIFLSFVFLPAEVKQRIASTFDLQDSTIQDRLKMLRTGLNIIGDYPVFGVGPEMIPHVYEEYKGEASDFIRPHLHNNIIQIAAERGLFTLLSWILFLISVGYYSIIFYRSALKGPPGEKQDAYLYIASLIIVLAILIDGLFEYNYGDTEIEMLFLFLVTIPFMTHKNRFKKAGTLK